MGKSEDTVGGLGYRFLFTAWLVAAVALGGLLGALRYSAESTPVRTGLRPPVAAATPAPPEAPAAAPLPTQIWTYRASKNRYISVGSLDEVPEEFRATATQTK